jgi:hypothetical protein
MAEPTPTPRFRIYFEPLTVYRHEDPLGVPDKLKLLMPDMPEDIFTALTANQIVSIAAKSWQVPGEQPLESQAREADASNPPAGERASAMSSRSPRDSSVGATES